VSRNGPTDEEDAMTTIDLGAATPQTVLDAVRELAPVITARAAEIEVARRLPQDLLAELKAAGCFRLLVPESHGGVGATLMDGMDALEVIAAADASVAWTVMIGAGSWCDLAGLPRTTFDALFAAGPDVVVAGAFNPTGSIAAVDGGYLVNGRWGFASGCEHADWLFGNCVEGVADGIPQLRVAVFSPDQVVIEDTWRVAGLSGTGSHHFRVEGLVVPAERTHRPLTEEPCIDAPIVRIPAPPLIALAIASVAIGTAQGALEEVVALAADKVPLLAGAPLATNALFHHELASADTSLRAARTLVHEEAEAVWAIASEGVPMSLQQRAHARATAAWATDQAAAAVTTAYRFGGGTSLYEESPLQRRLRDINAITQHFLVKPDTLTTAGAILAGQEPHLLVF
jgi:alkylation response protein AidB-like acyl-CoA dehydrogenase